MIEEALSYWTEIQRYEDMLAADPRSFCFAPLSDLYRKLGLLEDAVSVAQKGCEMHPEYPGAFFALGSAYLAKGLKDQARQAFERVVQLSPDNLQAQKHLGQLCAESGDLARSERALREVLGQDPDDSEAALLLRSVAGTSGAPGAAAKGGQEQRRAQAASEPVPRAGEELSEFDDLEDVEIIEELTEVMDEVPLDEDPFSGADFEEPPRLAESPAWSPAAPAELDDFIFDDEVAPATSAAAPAAPGAATASGKDPLTTGTLAELYVSQGFYDKAIAIYQELLAANPSQEDYRARRDELIGLRETQAPPAPAAAAPAHLGPEADPFDDEEAASFDATPFDAQVEASPFGTEAEEPPFGSALEAASFGSEVEAAPFGAQVGSASFELGPDSVPLQAFAETGGAAFEPLPSLGPAAATGGEPLGEWVFEKGPSAGSVAAPDFEPELAPVGEPLFAASSAADTPAPEQLMAVETELTLWLENIRRRRDGV